eukprot:CFRG6613T1
MMRLNRLYVLLLSSFLVMSVRGEEQGASGNAAQNEKKSSSNTARAHELSLEDGTSHEQAPQGWDDLTTEDISDLDEDIMLYSKDDVSLKILEEAYTRERVKEKLYMNTNRESKNTVSGMAQMGSQAGDAMDESIALEREDKSEMKETDVHSESKSEVDVEKQNDGISTVESVTVVEEEDHGNEETRSASEAWSGGADGQAVDEVVDAEIASNPADFASSELSTEDLEHAESGGEVVTSVFGETASTKISTMLQEPKDDFRTTDDKTINNADTDKEHTVEEQGQVDNVGEHLFRKALYYFQDFHEDSKVISMMYTAVKYGSDDALCFLARAQLFGLLDSPTQGFSREPDVAFALPLLEELVVERGHPEAQSLLAFIYSAGVNVDIDIPKSLIYQTFATEMGESYASASLGYKYFRGRNVPQDCTTAKQLYLSATANVAEGLKTGLIKPGEMIRLAQDEDHTMHNGMSQWDVLQYYQYMAQRGDIPSALIMGQVLLQGAHGIEQDPAQAADMFTQAAQAGSPDAKAFLASMHHTGVGVEGSNLTAYRLYKEAAEEGNSQGQNGLGQMYMHGIVVPQSYLTALKYFSLSAAQGNAEALFNVATLHYNGLGTPVDYKKAYENFQHSAKRGYTLSLYYLGMMHHLGVGTARSCDLAVTYLKNVYDRAASSELMADAYMAYKDGYTSKALLTYMYVAESGNELAQANAGYILELLATRHGQMTLHSHPNWIPKEDVEAHALLQWTKAAEQRSSEAILKKGDHYYYGWGVNASLSTAVECYRTAGTMHNAQALFNLGYMYERGEGTAQDFQLAKRFYDQSKDVSVDARIPVNLALLELKVRATIVSTLSWIESEGFKDKEDHPAHVWGDHWGIILVALLLTVLVSLIHLRRTLYGIDAYELEHINDQRN